MHTESSILIDAPVERIYAMTSDLIRWPAYLPHYRWVRWVEGGPDEGIVEMAAMRGAIPIKWTSEFRREPGKPELWFRHLSAFTKGMEVRWIYEQTAAGVLITIDHKLKFRFAPEATAKSRVRWVPRMIVSSISPGGTGALEVVPA